MSDAETPVTELSRNELEEIARSYRRLQDEFADIQSTIEFLQNDLDIKQDILFGDWSPNIAQLELDEESFFDEILALADQVVRKEELKSEQQTRTQKVSTLNRKIDILARECGVDLSDSRIRGEDKIKQVLIHGPGEVESTVYPAHERARDILANAGDWGSIVDDANGKRFTIGIGEARSRLKDKRDEELQSVEVRRAFEKVLDWAGDPRHAKLTKNGDGENQLTLFIDGGNE